MHQQDDLTPVLESVRVAAAQCVAADLRLEESKRQFHKAMICSMLVRTGGNKLQAAKLLGLHRNSLDRQIDELEIEKGWIRHLRLVRKTALRKQPTTAAAPLAAVKKGGAA